MAVNELQDILLQIGLTRHLPLLQDNKLTAADLAKVSATELELLGVEFEDAVAMKKAFKLSASMGRILEERKAQESDRAGMRAAASVMESSATETPKGDYMDPRFEEAERHEKTAMLAAKIGGVIWFASVISWWADLGYDEFIWLAVPCVLAFFYYGKKHDDLDAAANNEAFRKMRQEANPENPEAQEVHEQHNDRKDPGWGLPIVLSLGTIALLRWLEVESGLVHMGAVIAVAAVVRGLGGYR